jgi:hypothetical protein
MFPTCPQSQPNAIRIDVLCPSPDGVIATFRMASKTTAKQGDDRAPLRAILVPGDRVRNKFLACQGLSCSVCSQENR